MQPLQQAVERGEPGAALEDALEAPAQGCFGRRRRVPARGFEIVVEPPDQVTDQLASRFLVRRERRQLVDPALGVAPACDRLSPGKEDDVKTI
jgi:hypothetical protein